MAQPTSPLFLRAEVHVDITGDGDDEESGNVGMLVLPAMSPRSPMSPTGVASFPMDPSSGGKMPLTSCSARVPTQEDPSPADATSTKASKVGPARELAPAPLQQEVPSPAKT